MASDPSTTRTWIFANYPKGTATFGSYESKPTFKLVDRDLPALEKDQVLVKVVYFSNDPAQPPAIDESVKEERHYTAPLKLGDAMFSYALAEVVESKADNLSKGTIVTAVSGWTEYAVLSASECSPHQPLPNDLSLTHYMGAFGWPGMTAYYGLVAVGEAKRGQRIVVSGAAGATGSMVVQIAKNVSLPQAAAGFRATDSQLRLSDVQKSLALRVRTTSADGSKALGRTSV